MAQRPGNVELRHKSKKRKEMSEYKGKTVTVNMPAEAVCDKFADLSKLSGSLGNVPEEQLSKMGNLKFETRAVVIDNPMAGQLRFEVEERTPRRIVMACRQPIYVGMNIDMAPNATDEGHTDVTTSVEVDLPFFLKPMLGPKMQFVADGFAGIVAAIAGAEAPSEAAE